MKKRAVGALFLVLLLLTACGKTAVEQPITICFVGSLTGSGEERGAAVEKGAELAIDGINQAGGIFGRSLQLVRYDAAAQNFSIGEMMKQAVEKDKAVAVLGDCDDSKMEKAASYANEYGIVLVTGAPHFEIPNIKDGYVFRSVPKSDIGIAQLVQYAVYKGCSQVVAIAVNNEPGRAGLDEFVSKVSKTEIGITQQTLFQPGERYFTGILDEIMQTAPDAVFIWASGKDLGRVTRRIRQSGYRGLVMGPDDYLQNNVLESAGIAADGVVFASAYVIPTIPEEAESKAMRDFVKHYSAKYTDGLILKETLSGYDGVMNIAKAITDNGAVKTTGLNLSFKKISGLRGLAGEFDYTKGDGEGIHTLRVYQMQSGKSVEAR